MIYICISFIINMESFNKPIPRISAINMKDYIGRLVMLHVTLINYVGISNVLQVQCLLCNRQITVKNCPEESDIFVMNMEWIVRPNIDGTADYVSHFALDDDLNINHIQKTVELMQRYSSLFY